MTVPLLLPPAVAIPRVADDGGFIETWVEMQVQFICPLAQINHKAAGEGVTGENKGPALAKAAWVAGLTTNWENHQRLC